MLPSFHRRALRHCLAAAFVIAAPLQAQVAPVAHSRSAEIRNIRYEITFGPEQGTQGRLPVTTTFDVVGNEPVQLSLPSWTPGAYEISNFARFVTDFSPTANGRALDWDKIDQNTWRIEPAGARSITVSFTYLGNTLDNAMTWMRPDFLLFNGTNLFLYPEGRPLDFAAQVKVNTQPGWLVATGMTSAGAPHSYSATNYHDLVDMPFFVGRFDLDSAQIAGKWTRLATYPAGSVSGAVRERGWDWLKRAIPAEAAVFGGEVPWATYTVMQIADSTYPGASGLEHQSSHVDVINPFAMQSEFMPSLYAHEIFHAWNVKRLRPAEMWPYAYDREQPTPWLWVSEGITDYYADLAEVRGGIYDDSGFYASTAGKINEVSNAPPTALEDASLSTWIHPVDGSGYIYYQKGSLAGLLLDILIRDASDNKRSLDDVMRELYATTYKAGRGFTADDWWGAVGRAAGGSTAIPLAEFRERYIDGREPMPFERVFALAGLRTTRTPTPRLGVSSQADAQGVRVMQVDPGSAAAEAGVRPGDYLVSVGDVSVTDIEFGSKFRQRFGSAPEGSALPIVVRRDGQTLTLAGMLRFAPGEATVEVIPNASAKAGRIRNGILRGVTGG
jgi:predicted metalloprotease with PDZ domain